MLKNTENELPKKDKKSATRYEEIRLRDREQNKDIKNGTSILAKNLKNFDCSILTSYNHSFDIDKNNRKFAKLKYQSMAKGYKVFLVRMNLKNKEIGSDEIKDSVLVLFDSEKTKELENDTKIWASDNHQEEAFFIPKTGRAKEIFSEEEYQSYKKLKLARKLISKIIKKDFKFEDVLVMEFHKPGTIMGKRYASAVLKSLELEED